MAYGGNLIIFIVAYIGVMGVKELAVNHIEASLPQTQELESRTAGESWTTDDCLTLAFLVDYVL